MATAKWAESSALCTACGVASGRIENKRAFVRWATAHAATAHLGQTFRVVLTLPHVVRFTGYDAI